MGTSILSGVTQDSSAKSEQHVVFLKDMGCFEYPRDTQWTLFSPGRKSYHDNLKAKYEKMKNMEKYETKTILENGKISRIKMPEDAQNDQRTILRRR